MPDEPLLILIVDDSPEDRELYRRCLNSRSGRTYQFFEAESAQKGLAMCRLWPINCVLLDYRLPDLDGLEFLMKLRGNSAFVPVPVVMLTGLGSPQLEDKAWRGGAVVYLDKGAATPVLLSAAIQRAIKHHRQLTNSQKQPGP